MNEIFLLQTRQRSKEACTTGNFMWWISTILFLYFFELVFVNAFHKHEVLVTLAAFFVPSLAFVFKILVSVFSQRPFQIWTNFLSFPTSTRRIDWLAGKKIAYKNGANTFTQKLNTDGQNIKLLRMFTHSMRQLVCCLWFCSVSFCRFDGIQNFGTFYIFANDS